MSYEVTITGGEILTLDEQQGEKIKQLKLNGRPSDIIEIGDDVIELSRVRQIKHVADRTIKPLHRLEMPAKDRCRGKKSIQLEIWKIVKRQHPTDWPKFIRDKAYKEKIRLKLHEKYGDNWCDYLAKTCVCTADYTPDQQRVASMFPGAKPIDINETGEGT